jgi:hypothetical protein
MQDKSTTIKFLKDKLYNRLNKTYENILIIGGSKELEMLLQQLEKNLVHNISRNPPEVSHLT